MISTEQKYSRTKINQSFKWNNRYPFLLAVGIISADDTQYSTDDWMGTSWNRVGIMLSICEHKPNKQIRQRKSRISRIIWSLIGITFGPNYCTFLAHHHLLGWNGTEIRTKNFIKFRFLSSILWIHLFYFFFVKAWKASASKRAPIEWKRETGPVKRQTEYLHVSDDDDVGIGFNLEVRPD